MQHDAIEEEERIGRGENPKEGHDILYAVDTGEGGKAKVEPVEWCHEEGQQRMTIDIVFSCPVGDDAICDGIIARHAEVMQEHRPVFRPGIGEDVVITIDDDGLQDDSQQQGKQEDRAFVTAEGEEFIVHS